MFIWFLFLCSFLNWYCWDNFTAFTEFIFLILLSSIHWYYCAYFIDIVVFVLLTLLCSVYWYCFVHFITIIALISLVFIHSFNCVLLKLFSMKDMAPQPNKDSKEVDMDRKEELILAKQLRACRVSILPKVSFIIKPKDLVH